MEQTKPTDDIGILNSISRPHRRPTSHPSTDGLTVDSLVIDVPGRRLIDQLTFTVAPATSLAVAGPSGSGKTTLLNCLAGIYTPTQGQIRISGHEVTTLTSTDRAAFRLRNIGLVFQFSELLPELTVLENVAFPLMLLGTKRKRAEAIARVHLEQVGMVAFERASPSTLSGGEAQRVAIARALVHEPTLILADEPTGALDLENTLRVTDLLCKTARECSASLVIATHDQVVANAADGRIQLRDINNMGPGNPVPEDK